MFQNTIQAIEVRLHTKNLQREIDFFQNVFGFEVDLLGPTEHPEFAILVRDGKRIQLSSAPDRGPATDETLVIQVSNAMEVHRRIAEIFQIEWGPEVYSYGRREFAFRDPDSRLLIVTEETNDTPTCDVD